MNKCYCSLLNARVAFCAALSVRECLCFVYVKHVIFMCLWRFTQQVFVNFK
ncbi:hypothetical protein HMPREF3216_01161 [Gardnerella vaginalis]|uniref:Uncharacterized protein n=1 Tax=Gardnerella vaginalis TaxID=2702 RepID=A0A133NMC8_GARVA|nr:hypothetical protein HMPREF3216_01161 [Gardnerella vaginalis]